MSASSDPPAATIPRMTRQGKFDASAHTLAAMLVEGAEATVVGGEFLSGSTQVWIDEEMQVEWHQRKAANGIFVRWPDGRTAMFVTDQRDAADHLLARAQEIASNV